MSTFYIDPLVGDSENDGLSPLSPKETHKSIDIKPGDKVLFRRGSVFRGGIKAVSGEKEAPVYYGAYGNGREPVFMGSVNRSEPYLWKQTEKENVWELAVPLTSEPCNIIFDFGEYCGVLAWDMESLDSDGKWFSDSIGDHSVTSAGFFLFCHENPGLHYRDIEIAVYGDRMLATAKSNVTFEGLAFSMGGVHGFAATRPENVHINDCRFEFIGGCVWNKERKIRFGNGAEFWDGANDCSVTDCVFCDIYDSCVTTQGSAKMTAPENITYTGNTFMRYGMAAYEIRDMVGINVLFEFNVCEDAGGGFSIQDETPPRNSEIYPEPMGYHIFAWRIDKATERGETIIRRNVFSGKPLGCETYLRISDVAKKQIKTENNESR